MGHMLRFIIAVLCLILLLGCAQETKDTIPPTAPSNLVKTSPDNDNTPTFSWSASSDEGSGIDCYLVRIPGHPFYEYWTFNGDSSSFTCPAPLSDGSYAFEVKTGDRAMNESATASLTFTIDTIPPVISAVSAASADGSAVITWSTDEPATSLVEYGRTTSYGTTTGHLTVPPTLVTSHSVSLGGLDSATSYHFRVISRDEAGNVASSSDCSFITTARDSIPLTIFYGL